MFTTLSRHFLSYFFHYRIYDKILDRDWFSARLFVTAKAIHEQSIVVVNSKKFRHHVPNPQGSLETLFSSWGTGRHDCKIRIVTIPFVLPVLPVLPVDLIRRSWVRFPPRSKDFFFASCGSLFPFTRANAQWVIHGFK